MHLQRLKLKCNWCNSDELVERCGIMLSILIISHYKCSPSQPGWPTQYRVDNWDLIVLFWQKQEIFLFIKVSRLVLRATQPTIQ